MERFLATYRQLDGRNLHLLADIYRRDVVFVDPAHEIVGLDQLRQYFSALFANVDTISFDFTDVVGDSERGYVRWTMAFSHRRLKGGATIRVEGASFLRFDPAGLVTHHRDYFDLGAMLYEHIPLLGSLITTIKRRLGS